jgi:hypothetical protein
MSARPAHHITPLLLCNHKAIKGKHCLQLLSDHAAIVALLPHHEHHAILISQDQQIILNRQCAVGISEVDAVLRSGYPDYGQG